MGELQCPRCSLRHAAEPHWKFCPACGYERDLSRRARGVPLAFHPYVLRPSKSGGWPHRLQIGTDRTVAPCSSPTCLASHYGTKCSEHRLLEERLLARKERELVEILETAERVETILLKDDPRFGGDRLSWRNDIVLQARYFEHWHNLTPESTLRDYYWVLAHYYNGNHPERIRRVRAHFQSPLNPDRRYVPDGVTGAFRQANEAAFRQAFGASQSKVEETA